MTELEELLVNCKYWATYDGGTCEYEWCKAKGREAICQGLWRKCPYPKTFRGEVFGYADRYPGSKRDSK